MRQPPGRIAIVAVATVLAILSVLFPPWRARAIRTTTRFAAVSGVAPATIVDTVEWSLSFVSIFAPPRAPLSGGEMRALAVRSLSGDSMARDELRRRTEPFERRYHAPEIIRMDGEVWRDSVLAVAGIPAISSYEASFALADGWIAARLIAIVVIACYVDYRRRLRAATA